MDDKLNKIMGDLMQLYATSWIIEAYLEGPGDGGTPEREAHNALMLDHRERLLAIHNELDQLALDITRAEDRPVEITAADVLGRSTSMVGGFGGRA